MDDPNIDSTIESDKVEEEPLSATLQLGIRDEIAALGSERDKRVDREFTGLHKLIQREMVYCLT